MRATGIVRQLDRLGRVVLPKELRDTFEITQNTPVEIFVGDNGEIILRKYKSECVLCGDEKTRSELYNYKAALICRDCFSMLS